jgi:hypothetical protein
MCIDKKWTSSVRRVLDFGFEEGYQSIACASKKWASRVRRVLLDVGFEEGYQSHVHGKNGLRV